MRPMHLGLYLHPTPLIAGSKSRETTQALRWLSAIGLRPRCQISAVSQVTTSQQSAWSSLGPGSGYSRWSEPSSPHFSDQTPRSWDQWLVQRGEWRRV